MRRTDEEFAAEVMRRSVVYRAEKKKQMRRLAAASVSVFAVVLMGGVYLKGQSMRSQSNMAADAAPSASHHKNADGVTVMEEAMADEAPAEEAPVYGTQIENETAYDHMNADRAAADEAPSSQEDIDGSDEAVLSGESYVLQMRLPHAAYAPETTEITMEVCNQGTSPYTLHASDFSMKMQQGESTGYCMFDGAESEIEIPEYGTVEWTLKFADFGIPAPAPAGEYTIILGGSTVRFTITE